MASPVQKTDANNGLEKAELDLVRPYIEATLETIRVQGGIQIRDKEPYVAGSRRAHRKDLIAVFTVFSEGFNINVSLCFQKSVYLSLMHLITGEECKEIDSKTKDGILELVSIIFNKARKLSNSNGRLLNRSIPTIILGEPLTVW